MYKTITINNNIFIDRDLYKVYALPSLERIVSIGLQVKRSPKFVEASKPMANSFGDSIL